MKKSIWMLLLALLLALTTLALAEDAPARYASDFSAGEDGWYARSGGGASVAAADGALTITGRTDDWNSPGRDFPLVPGKSYNVSVQVKQDGEARATFKISVAHTLDGVESYENLGEAAATRGDWTTISGSWSAGEFDRFVLYVETSGAPTLDFAIRDFKVEPVETLFAGDAIPSLKEVYRDAFDFGCAVTKSEADSKERMDFYASQFSLMTPGNEMKPESLLDHAACRKLAEEDDTAVALRFGLATPLLDYAQAHGVKVHGHVLVWHSQTPEWFFHKGYDEKADYVTREVMLARMENYIHGVLSFMEENYPGVIVSWDVVNEAVEDGSDKLRESNWTKVVGEDFVNRAFELADRYATEDTLLFYNDYSTPFEPKLTGICNLLDSLIADGHIDGYGFQGHYQVGSPTMAQLREAFERIAAKGLKLRVSELDITVNEPTDRNFRRQAEAYAAAMAVFKEYAGQLIAVQTWGVTDNLSWKASGYPLLFDGQGQPKYAFWALTDPSRIPEEVHREGVAYGPATEADFDRAIPQQGDRFAFRALYTEAGELLVRVDVEAGEAHNRDRVRVFADGASRVLMRKKAEATENGYTATFTVPVKAAKDGDQVAFDVMICEGEETRGWNDNTTAQDRVMGTLTLRPLLPLAEAVRGSTWENASPIACAVGGSADADEGGTVRATAYAAWDEQNLYVKVDVEDAYLDDSAANSYEQDSVELFLDERNDRTPSYGEDDHHYRVNFAGVTTIDAGYDTVQARAERTETGFIAYFTVPWTVAPAADDVLGFDIRYNNAGADGKRRLLNFCDGTDRGWSDPTLFGLLKLTK